MEPEHVALREFIERILSEREKSILMTVRNFEHRLESLNRLREDVILDRTIFLSKDVYEQMHQAILERVQSLERAQSKIVGVGVTIIVVTGLVGALAGAVIAHLMR